MTQVLDNKEKKSLKVGRKANGPFCHLSFLFRIHIMDSISCLLKTQIDRVPLLPCILSLINQIYRFFTIWILVNDPPSCKNSNSISKAIFPNQKKKVCKSNKSDSSQMIFRASPKLGLSYRLSPAPFVSWIVLAFYQAEHLKSPHATGLVCNRSLIRAL